MSLDPGGPLRKPRGHYHHGELRAALVAAALRVVREEGVAALSLRELARELGVSHAAPAHHFPDRTALLVALAGEGFERLRDVLAAARKRGDRPRTRLRAVGRAFVAFALDEPGYFRVMFGPHVASLPRAPAAIAEAAEAGFAIVAEAVADVVGRRDRRLPQRSFGVWSLLHGAATLFLDGLVVRQLPDLSERATFEAWVEAALDGFL